MKLRTRKLLAFLMAALMLAMTAACALEDDTSSETQTYSAKERAKVAVKIGDKYEITKGDVVDAYNSYISMYEYYGMTAPTEDADIETMQDTAVSSLVSEKLLLYQADQQGIALSDEQLAAVETKVDEEMAYWTDYFTSQAESEGAEDVETRMAEIFSEQLAASGLDMDMDGYEAYMREAYMNDAIITALEDSFKATITITDEEVQAYYDNLLETQKAAYDETPSSYQTDQEAYEMNGGNPVLYTPEGFMRVRTITVSPENEIDAAYTTLQTEMDALEAEYGSLLLTYGETLLDVQVEKAEAEASEDEAATETAGDAEATDETPAVTYTYTAVNAPDEETGKAAERLAEIRDAYNTKKVEADAIYEEYLTDARLKIQNALKALDNGDSFEEVLATFGEDDMYTTYPIFAEKGILMLREGETNMDEKLVKAALELDAGAYSGIIQVDDMFYIISPVGDEPAGTKAFADVADEIRTLALNEKAETAWTEQQDTWMADETAVTYYEDVYRDIGK